MNTLTKTDQNFLKETLADRVTFDRFERKLYGHDIGDLPKLIKPLLGKTIPDAVAQPQSEAELISLTKWAWRNRVPLTPRGKATSGYGGVLPIKKGVVIDFHRLNKLIKVDTQKEQITVQAGMVWEKLDQELNKHGLTLRLYPTSYMASTVGGWLAQGGAGIGSFEMGWFHENVISARVVLPNGETKEYAKDELDFVSKACGISGFISEITLKVQAQQEMEVISIATDSALGLQKISQALVDQQLPIWSFLFINPRMAAMKNKTPLMEHLGHAVEERVLLPESFIITLTYKTSVKQEVAAKLPAVLAAGKGRQLAERIAMHEWEHRFNIMQVKRLGPSLVPAEVVVPLDSLALYMDEIQKKITQPVVKEGIIIRQGEEGKPEVVILGFIPSDQRRFSYHFIYSLSLSIMKIAEKHGGRAYSTGLYFSAKAPQVLGTNRLKQLKIHKKQVDPAGIMNPGKVISNSLVGSVIGMAQIFEPFTRAFANTSKTQIGVRADKALKDIPADVAWHAYSCSQCGFCVSECDQFYGRGWESQSPRGKWYWLREYMEGREEWSQKMTDTILSCTTCELCNQRCSEALPIEPSWMKLRGVLINEEKKMTFPPFEMMTAALLDQGNIWAGYRKDRAGWFPDSLKEKHGPGKKSSAVYFAGCTASYVEHDIGMATAQLLDAAGIDYSYLGEQESCCGTPMLAAGKWDAFEVTMKHNIQMVKESGADTVISSCPACDMMWRQVYPIWAEKLNIPYGIKAQHYSEVVSEKITAGEFSFPANGHHKEKVTWHDSCHMGRVSGVYEPPRELIKAIPQADFVEMSHNRANAHCCGSVLTLIKEPKVAAVIGKVRLDEAVGAGAEKLLALCPCCEFQLRVSANKTNAQVEVVDLARYAAEALGFDLPDPNPEVKKQWAVFEAMIPLMTPKGFADLMGTMWPELVDAMPYGMGSMMRGMGKIPGALSLMKPLFPLLFPSFLPKMMPKVMPVMLNRIASRIPMPDYMAEQMPLLMPKIMDNLMPHMLGELVPLVTQPLLDHLRGKKETSEEV